MCGSITPAAPFSKDNDKVYKAALVNFILLKIDISYLDQLRIKRKKHITKG